MKPRTWPTEVAMFGAFQASARALGFTCYPESCGHDLVLRAGTLVDCDATRGLDLGDVIAVEGKLRPTFEVLRQALPPLRHMMPQASCADFYAVLVPGCDADFRSVAFAAGIVVLTMPAETESFVVGAGWSRGWHEDLRQPTAKVAPLSLPEVAVRMEAGSPGPRSITPWKLAAVRICIDAESGKPITSATFRTADVRPHLWIQRGWIRPDRREGRMTVYALLDAPDRPDRMYPEIAAAMRDPRSEP